MAMTTTAIQGAPIPNAIAIVLSATVPGTDAVVNLLKSHCRNMTIDPIRCDNKTDLHLLQAFVWKFAYYLGCIISFQQMR